MNQFIPEQATLFALGRIVATPGARTALSRVQQSPQVFLARHAQGDWGDMAPDDLAANAQALQDGRRLFSAYTLTSGIRLWVMTSANRAVTKVLLPLEYEQEDVEMQQTAEAGGRMVGCQSTNHSECYGELWQCAACGKTVCYAEGTTDHPELCDDCWAKRFAQDPGGVTIQDDNTMLLDCACTEVGCATWLALTGDGVLTLEDKDGLCVSLQLPTWLDEAMRVAMTAHLPPETTPT